MYDACSFVCTTCSWRSGEKNHPHASGSSKTSKKSASMAVHFPACIPESRFSPSEREGPRNVLESQLVGGGTSRRLANEGSLRISVGKKRRLRVGEKRRLCECNQDSPLPRVEVSLVSVILFPCRQIGIRDRVTFASTFQVSARPPANVHV